MINAGIAGLGWWGKTLVEAVSGSSDRLRFVAGATRTHSDETKAFTAEHGLDLRSSYDELIDDPKIDAVVLATPHSMHADQVVAAASKGKHVYCEKPFALTKAEAETAVDAVKKAGVALGLGYNRRWHPEMTKLRDQIHSGELGVILHCEATMTFPNALMLKADAWRASRDETPCGGLTPMGVHAIDGMIDLCGLIDEVYCQSFRRAVEIDAFSFQVYGSKGYVRLEGMTHVAGAPSEERRTRLFGNCIFKPLKGPAETWQAATLDIVKATLEDFAVAASGGTPFMITTDEMIHVAAVTEAIVKSAATHQIQKVP
jgi:predicted dehydrogenase